MKKILIIYPPLVQILLCSIIAYSQDIPPTRDFLVEHFQDYDLELSEVEISEVFTQLAGVKFIEKSIVKDIEYFGVKAIYRKFLENKSLTMENWLDEDVL